MKKTIIIISIFLLLIPFIETKDKNSTIKKLSFKLNKIIKNKAELYDDSIGNLEIKKINLSKKIYPINSLNNNLEKNIKLLPDSNKEKNLFIIASHSGNNYNAYFNNLDKLEISDKITLYYEKKVLTYKIKDIYNINKTGYLTIPVNLTNTLILITCDIKSKDQQRIIISEI